MDTPPPEVEFEHRRLRPGAVPPSLQQADARLGSLQVTMVKRARLWRASFVIAGAVGIAWVTQHLGIELPYAICLFFGALPVLWVGGWLFGFLFHARRTVKRVSTTVGSTQWQGELEAVTVIEKVKLSLTGSGLQLARDADRSVVPWARVRMERVGPETLMLYLGEATGLALNEGLMVPRSAFASDTAFDDFCLSMQRSIWEAQRRG